MTAVQSEASRREITDTPVKPKIERRKVNVKRDSAIIGGLVAGTALLVGGLLHLDADQRKDTRIENLEAAEAEQERLLETALTLGSAGVRFSDILYVQDSETDDRNIVVEVPGTGPNCQSISFNFSNTSEGWTLNLNQADAAGNIYDDPEAHDAASVAALVQDLCN